MNILARSCRGRIFWLYTTCSSVYKNKKREKNLPRSVIRLATAVNMSAAKEPQRRNCLKLKKKVEVIHFHRKNPSTFFRALGEKFECSKTQIDYIFEA